MKALTILQPWASLIAQGHKRIETRGWSTTYRGPIAIHAGKSQEYAFLLKLEAIAAYHLADIPLGAVVATASLVDCVRITRDFRDGLPDAEVALGDYTTGRYGWVLEDVQRLPNPIPARGAQGLWEWAESATEVGR